MKKILVYCTLFVMTLANAGEGNSAVKGEHAGHGAVTGTGKPSFWTRYPTLKTRATGESRDNSLISLSAKNLLADRFDAYSNNLDDMAGHRQLPIELAGALLDKPQSGGFHWLTARGQQGDQISVASTVYYFSNPGKNPTAMFMQQKNELEVIPQPYPREHSRYRANEDWLFLVRFNSRPLAAQKVTLETSNGSRAELLTDAQGMVRLHLPDDFRMEPEKSGKEQHSHGHRMGDFVLATEHAEAGKSYLTAFNSGYGPDAYDGRSLAWGLGFTLLGMVSAVPLLRQRKGDKKSANAAPGYQSPVNESRES